MLNASGGRGRTVWLVALLLLVVSTGFAASTTAANGDPDPNLVAVNVPDEVEIGDSFTLEITGENSGETAGHYSTISVSMPSLDESDDGNQVNIIDASDHSYQNKVSRGESLYNRHGEQIQAEYLLVEAGTDNSNYWYSNSDRSLSIEVTPEETGTFELYVRVTLTDENDASVSFTDPGSSSYTDQQDFYVYRHEVEVKDKPSDLETTIEYGDGTTADEANAIEIYKNDLGNRLNDKSVYDYGGVGLPHLFDDLEPNQEYLAIGYVQDMKVGDTGWVQLGGDDYEYREITPPDPVPVDFEVYYSDGTTPVEGAEVRITSHEGTEWRNPVTDGNGGATTWLQPSEDPNNDNEYFDVEIIHDGSVVATDRIYYPEDETRSYTTDESPPPGTLEVAVNDQNGDSADGVDVQRYRIEDSGDWTPIDGKSTDSNGEVTWSDVDPDDYALEVYSDGEFWGGASDVTVQSGKTTDRTLARTTPWVEFVANDGASVGESTEIRWGVTADESNSRDVEGTAEIRNSAGTVVDESSFSGTVPSDSNEVFTTEFVPEEAGKYCVRIRLETYVGSPEDPVLTDTRPKYCFQVSKIELRTTREGSTIVGSPLTMGVERIDGEQARGAGYEYDWSVVDSPDGAQPELLHTDERVTSLRPTVAGSYQLRVDVTSPSGENVGQETTIVDASPGSVSSTGTTELELLKKFAPVLHFHPEEDFYPTRYETLVENSVIDRAGGGQDENVTLLELSNPEYADSEQELTVDPIAAYGGDESAFYQDFTEIQTEYPRTVYGSVHEGVSFSPEGSSTSNEYTAVVYWLVYANDPKPPEDKVGESGRVFRHTGDLEPLVVLVDDNQNPQWVGAQQHFGGELRQWKRVRSEGTHPKVYPALGAHSNYLYNNASSTDFLPQKQYFRCDLLEVACYRGLGDQTEIDMLFATQYRDYTGNEVTWRVDSTSNNPYEISVLTGEESWGGDNVRIHTYPSSDFAPDEVDASSIFKPGFAMNSDVWGTEGLSSWLEEDIYHDYEMEKTSLIHATSPKVNNGHVEFLATISNSGPMPERVLLDVEMKPADASWSESSHQSTYPVALESPSVGGSSDSGGSVVPGHPMVTLSTNPHTDQVSIKKSLPDNAEGKWDVRVSLWNYEEGKRIGEEDFGGSSTDSFYVEPQPVDATVAFVETPESDFAPGETVDSVVEVENTGEQKHTFFVGYSAVGPYGETYDNGGQTGKPVTLEPGESRQVEVSWTVEEDRPSGQYDLITAVWEESDRDNLKTRLDDDYRQQSVYLAPEPSIDIEGPSGGEVQPGEEFEVELQARNDGVKAGWQSVAVSFPGLETTEHVTVVDHTLDGVEKYGVGTEVGADYGTNRTELDYPLVEGHGVNWTQANGTETLRLRIRAPENGDQFRLQFKSVATDANYRHWTADPLDGDGDSTDQQGEYVYEEVVQLTDGAYFDITVDDSESTTEVSAGEDAVLSSTVTNTGDTTTTQTVTLSVDGDQKAAQDVQLAAGESQTVTFNYETRAEDDGAEAVVATSNATDSRTLTVTTPASFELSNLDPGSMTVTEGADPVSVAVDVANTGEEHGQRDLQFRVVDSETGTVALERSRTVELDGGTQTTTTFEQVPVGDLDPGEYTYEIVTANDSLDGSLVVEPDPGAFFAVDITQTNSPIDENETLRINVSIENVGEEFGDQIIDVGVAGVGNDSMMLALEANESETRTFALETSDGDAGTYDVLASSANDSDARAVEIEPNGSSTTPPVADAGEAQSVVENTSVVLDGTESSDPDGDELSYSWEQTYGPTISLQDAETATPEFTAPAVDSETLLVFELTVSDGTESSTASVNVSVTPQPPTADVTFPIDVGADVAGGLTADEEYVYSLFGFQSNESEYVGRIDPATEETVESYAVPGGSASGIASDGSGLWTVDFHSDEVARIDPSTGGSEVVFQSAGDPAGVGYGNTTLWVADIYSNEIHRYKTNGEEVDSFSIGSETTNVKGVTYHEGRVWVGDGDGNVFVYTPDGELLEEHQVGATAHVAGTDRWGVLVPTGNESITQLTGGEPSVGDYTNDQGVVESDNLRTAVDDWRSGEIETSLLRDVVDAWRTGAQVG